ncbi:MAG: iron ABC transporter permease [Planctomycetaceae bacterium]|nr:iron ABC transporter permease [Planctomycetaceae bacterium]
MNILTPQKLFVRLLLAAIVLAILMSACMFVGSEPISFGKVLEGPGPSGFNLDYTIFMQVRLPRVILAAIVGAALACAGVIFQTILRNPLADPYILGISSGAGLGIMLAVMLGWTWSFAGLSPVMLAAFAGAMAAVWLVWGIGRFTGRSQVTGLLLAGVVVNAFFSAVIMFLTSIAKAFQLQTTLFWLMGSFAEIENTNLLFAFGGVCLAGIVVLMLLGTRLNLLSYGADQARAMGVPIEQTCRLAFACAALMTAVAVSLSGLIGFVGLIVPHAVRLVAGSDHRQLIPLSALTGASFLVVADAAARFVAAPAMLPVGVITALTGGPFFLFLLIRYTKNIHWGHL